MLDPYIDNELLVETSQLVIDHLSTCSDCSADSERRIELRHMLMAALTDDAETDGEYSLRKRIQAALARERSPRTTARVRLFALAAGVIVTLTLAVAYWRINSVPWRTNSSAIDTAAPLSPILIAAVDRDAVENHQVCALSYPSNWAFDRQRVERTLTPGFVPLIDAIGRNPEPYELVEGHICKYKQKQYAHLIFRGNGHTISVFVENDSPGDAPKPSRSPEIDQAGYEAYRVARVDTGLHRIFVVSDLSGDENLALANQLLPSALGFVRELEVHAS